MWLLDIVYIFFPHFCDDANDIRLTLRLTQFPPHHLIPIPQALTSESINVHHSSAKVWTQLLLAKPTSEAGEVQKDQNLTYKVVHGVGIWQGIKKKKKLGKGDTRNCRNRRQSRIETQIWTLPSGWNSSEYSTGACSRSSETDRKLTDE